MIQNNKEISNIINCHDLGLKTRRKTMIQVYEEIHEILNQYDVCCGCCSKCTYHQERKNGMAICFTGKLQAIIVLKNEVLRQRLETAVYD